MKRPTIDLIDLHTYLGALVLGGGLWLVLGSVGWLLVAVGGVLAGLGLLTYIGWTLRGR